MGDVKILDMDAISEMGRVIKALAENTADRGGIGCAKLVTLKKKVCSVVVLGVCTMLVIQHEVSILVGLRLARLDFVADSRQVPGGGQLRSIIVIPVVAGEVGRILELEGTLSDDCPGEFHRKYVSCRKSRRLRVG